MISPFEAQLNSYAYLSKKHKEILEKIDKIITKVSKEGGFVASIPKMSYEESEEIISLLKKEGYNAYIMHENLLIKW